MYIINNKGPKTDPCGILCSVNLVSKFDRLLLNLTCCINVIYIIVLMKIFFFIYFYIFFDYISLYNMYNYVYIYMYI